MPRLNNEKGQGLIEYILVVVIMAVGSILLIHKLNSKTEKGFNKAATTLNTEFS